VQKIRTHSENGCAELGKFFNENAQSSLDRLSFQIASLINDAEAVAFFFQLAIWYAKMLVRKNKGALASALDQHVIDDRELSYLYVMNQSSKLWW
jgi:hypothetical protein